LRKKYVCLETAGKVCVCVCVIHDSNNVTISLWDPLLTCLVVAVRYEPACKVPLGLNLVY
jgi:hypothetical protein